MMLLIRFFTLILCCTLFFSCHQNEEQYQKISGKWKGADWLVKGQPSGKNMSRVSFEFNPDKTYKSQLGSNAESGTFKVDGDHLYTTAEGKLEIMVKIARLSADSLVLDMNNSGQDETLILVKN